MPAVSMTPEELAAEIRLTRAVPIDGLVRVARRMFEHDVAVVASVYKEGGRLFHENDLVRLRADIYALLTRRKYSWALPPMGWVQFTITIYLRVPQIQFDSLDLEEFLKTYAVGLKHVTPDTDFLLIPLSLEKDVKPYRSR